MPKAFPGASGWGAESDGGRGGTIKVVSNLNDSGAGSLRAALVASGARIIVFTVAGLIDLLTTITVSNPYFTIAGQTAPGSGIVLQGRDIRVETHNGIIRFLRWRLDGTDDNIMLFLRGTDAEGCHDHMIDHCSFAWQLDDMLATYVDGVDYPTHHVSVQNSLFTEPSPAHPTGYYASADTGTTEKPHHVSYHNNLSSNVGHRNPLMRCDQGEVINDVVYNYGTRVGYFIRHRDLSGGPEVDYINNYWERGPKGADRALVWDEISGDVNDPAASIYVSGNILPDASVPLTDPEADNWVASVVSRSGVVISTDHQRGSRLDPQPAYPVPLISATVARTRVLTEAGANARLTSEGNWVANRDSVDQGAVDDATNDTGPGSLPSIPGTMPSVDSGTAYTDTDGDGMADDWEDLHGLDKNSSADQNSYTAGNGYTNIENFLNGIPILELGGPGGL